jgi:hypothetical protein
LFPPPPPYFGVEIILRNLQIAWDDARRLAKRRIEREQGRNDAADDLSELSEGEKEKGDVSEPVKEISRINSEMHIWSDDDKSRRLYIVLIRYIFCILIAFLFLIKGLYFARNMYNFDGDQITFDFS